MFLIKSELCFFCVAAGEVGWLCVPVPSLERCRASVRELWQDRELDPSVPSCPCVLGALVRSSDIDSALR